MTEQNTSIAWMPITYAHELHFDQTVLVRIQADGAVIINWPHVEKTAEGPFPAGASNTEQIFWGMSKALLSVRGKEPTNAD